MNLADAIGTLAAWSALVVAIAGAQVTSAGTVRSEQAAMPLRAAIGRVTGAPDLRAPIAAVLREGGAFKVLDADMVESALSGARYEGSLNLTEADARRLCQVCGADVLVLSVASIVDRGPEAGAQPWDAAVGILIVDGRTGALARYASLAGLGGTRAGAVAEILAQLEKDALSWPGSIARVRTAPRPEPSGDFVDLVASADVGEGESPPRFFKRPHPELTPDGERFRVSATVDAIVEFKADGTYGRVDVVRWAGFGLDEASQTAIRAAAFVPAKRHGRPIDARALLRFNFKYVDK